MNTTPEDDAIARLRAADPAAKASVDLESLRTAVGARLGEEAAVSGTTTDELAAARARRPERRRAWFVAAAAVAMLAVGAGGYALGGRGAPPSASGDAPLPPISLQNPGGQGNPVPSDENAVAAGTAPAPSLSSAEGAGLAAADYSSEAELAMYWQRLVFTASGLSDERGRAEAFAYDPGSIFGPEVVQQWAAALGVDGEVREEDGSWIIGSYEDGSQVVYLYPDGMAGLSYYNPALDPWYCGPEDEVREDGTCSDTEVAAAPTDALQIAQDALTAAGVDVSAYEWFADTAQEGVAYVSGYAVIDGRMTGESWSVSVTAEGINSIYGSLAPRFSLGEYDLVSENEAVQRLSDPRFGAQGGVMPLAAIEDMGVVTEEMIEPAPDVPYEPTVPARVEPGSEIAWPVRDVTIVDASLTLANFVANDGASLLLPAYELTDGEGSTWTVIALADDSLNFAAE